MCHSGLSSAWLLEDIQYESNYQNSFNPKTGVIEIPQKEKLIQFIIDRIEHVEEIEFAGGEPFLISDYFTLIKEFKRVKNYNVKIRFHTNASSLYCKGEYIPNLLKEFKNVTIMLSIDGYGEVNDYTRKGSIYEKIVANVTALHREIPDVYLRLVPTISIPTVYSVPFMYIDFLRKGLVGHRDIACRPLYGPEYLNIQTLPLEDKLKIVKFYNYFIDNITTKLLQRFPGESVTYVKQEFSSIMNFMLLKNQIEQFNSKRFRESIKRLDIRRDESYEDILPETAHLLSGGISTYNLDDKYNELKNFIDSI
jgi:sulfatase maturation enzyme AslB (radical SAM superfamily)